MIDAITPVELVPALLAFTVGRGVEGVEMACGVCKGIITGTVCDTGLARSVAGNGDGGVLALATARAAVLGNTFGSSNG